MPNFKDAKVASLIKDLAADFMQRESSGASLVTITRVGVSDKLDKATIFFTVLPESEEKAVEDFAKRRAGDFRTYVRNHSRMHFLPYFYFEIDKGEKNRVKLDTLK